MKVPPKFQIQTNKGELRAKADSRHRLYVKNLYKKFGLMPGQKIEVSRKNDKYYFTAF